VADHLRSLGLTGGTVGERMLALNKDPRFTFPNNDAGRAQVLDFIQQRLAIIRGKMPLAFRTLARGNVEVRRFGQGDAPAWVQDHVDLGDKLGMLDFDRASRMSGARFVVLRGQLARLERALANYMLDIQTQEHG